MVDSLTKKDNELVDLQIKIKNMMDKNENNLSPEGQEITDILKSEIHILSKEVADLKEGIIDKETLDLKIQSLNSTCKNQEDLIEKFKSETDMCRKKEAELSSRIQEQEENFGALKQKLESEKKENRSLKADLTQKGTIFNEMENIKKDQIREIQKLESSLKVKEQDNERFMREKEDLLAKIESGDGANMAIQQLTSENSIL